MKWGSPIRGCLGSPNPLTAALNRQLTEKDKSSNIVFSTCLTPSPDPTPSTILDIQLVSLAFKALQNDA